MKLVRYGTNKLQLPEMYNRTAFKIEYNDIFFKNSNIIIISIKDNISDFVIIIVNDMKLKYSKHELRYFYSCTITVATKRYDDEMVGSELVCRRIRSSVIQLAMKRIVDVIVGYVESVHGKLVHRPIV